MRFLAFKTFTAFISVSIGFFNVSAQSRHRARNTSNVEGVVLSITASRTDGKTDPIRAENLYLYENYVEQKIKNFSYDPSPSRIVLLVDNSKTVPVTVKNLRKATMEFAYEIFEGDQLFVIAYDEKPEILQEWTDDPKKLGKSLMTFRKKGNPHLFDAMNASVEEVLLPLMPGMRKAVIVVIGDGLDRGSKISFDKVLNKLQNNDITVYALQVKDRTGGAYRRYQPKATQVIKSLTKDTGGKAFPIHKAREAAKLICDELRKNRYLLSYLPNNATSYNERSIFIDADDGIKIRVKSAHPPNIK